MKRHYHYQLIFLRVEVLYHVLFPFFEGRFSVYFNFCSLVFPRTFALADFFFVLKTNPLVCFTFNRIFLKPQFVFFPFFFSE